MVRRAKLHGEDIIILEEHPQCFFWVPEAALERSLTELGIDVRDTPDIAGKTLREHIKDDTFDEIGWGEYKEGLRELGIDV